jgi:hypothetical protein
MKRLVVLLVAVAAAVALAGVYLPSEAATVGGTSISRQSLDSDLSAIAGSPDYTCFLSEERQLASGRALPFLGAGTPSARGGVYDAAFVDDWLGSMITDQVTADVLAAHGLRVTSADRSVARGALVRRMDGVLDQYARDAESPSAGCGGNAQTVLSSLPAWFVAEQTRAAADQDVLDAHAAGAGLSGAAISAYFSGHRRAFDRDCLDVVVVKSTRAATKVETALAQGVSFATEAQTASITQTSAVNGGSVGCGLLDGTFLAGPVGKLAVGGITSPISADGAYWVVRLASRSTVQLGSVRATVVTSVIQAGQARAGEQLTAALRSSTVGVDPRYGIASRDHLTLVAAAPTPPSDAELSTSANLPALTAASS